MIEQVTEAMSYKQMVMYFASDIKGAIHLMTVVFLIAFTAFGCGVFFAYKALKSYIQALVLAITGKPLPTPPEG